MNREDYLALYEQSMDVDGDGWKNANAEGVDCDDFDETVFPDAPELCDEQDNDCDGEIDEGVIPRYFADADLDGRGDPETFIDQCAQPEGWVENDFDCDDSDGTVYPAAEELCDLVDNDCDARVDEGSFSVFADADGDGYGDPTTEEAGCALESGLVDVGGDCDDGDASVSPAADERCDGIDNNCDGEVDEDAAVDAGTWYVDADADGHGDSEDSRAACAQPEGFSPLDDDCDDSDADVSPSLEEVCNDFKDNDCDGGPGDCEHSGELPLGGADAVLRGEAKYSYAGAAVGGGDLDGDGLAELVIGAPDYGADGTVYVLMGPISGELDLGAADATLTGTTAGSGAAMFGSAIAIGDVRGSADPDLLVGAPGWQEDSRDRVATGGVMVWTSPPVGQETANDAEKLLADGGSTSTSTSIGSAVSAWGDLSGDGISDAAVGAPEALGGDGVVRIYVGRQSSSAADFFLNGSGGERAGASVAILEDVNGDGLADVLAGAPASDRGGSDSGAAYLVHGPITAVVELADADARVVGATGDELGTRVGGAGDVNGDGYEDLLTCAPLHDTGGSDAGVALLYLGPASGQLLPGDADLRFDGHQSQMNLCWDFVGGEDLNQDGALDLILSAPRFDDGADNNVGAVYLFRGPLSASVDSASADAVWVGTSRGDRAGWSIAGVGDVNGDSYPDLLIGAPWNGDTREDAGASYLILGAGL
ncbi:MAG: FG-GAP repeat protein [Alphaproteobacteria bacterium]|nr:FG-GAP repeat protein [Alphaproteobacteria bacterium]MCB9794583.1 FG-GAP repeat protein [Alphaproteobacteria bacterium]